MKWLSSPDNEWKINSFSKDAARYILKQRFHRLKLVTRTMLKELYMLETNITAGFYCNIIFYTVWVKKGNRDSILNLSKSKIRIMKLLWVDDNIFIFLSYGTLVVHIGHIRDGCSSIILCKTCQNCLHPSFAIVHKAVRMHYYTVVLLWTLPQMPPCSTNNANLDKTNFDMFHKIDCCAAIHGRIWMNNIPN